jgi:hypothetical protein
VAIVHHGRRFGGFTAEGRRVLGPHRHPGQERYLLLRPRDAVAADRVEISWAEAVVDAVLTSLEGSDLQETLGRL